ncbi:hypothetical protein V2A60_009884 [Cordyceps javanica]
MSPPSYGGHSRIEMLLAQIKDEFSGQQLQQHDDWQRQMDLQVGELQSMRQILDVLQQKHKTESTEYQTKLRAYEDTIHHLEFQLSSKTGITLSDAKNDNVSSPTNVKHHQRRKDQGNDQAASKVTPDWPDWPLEDVSSEHKQVGSDWYAVFNPRISQRLKVAHRYTLQHDAAVCCVRFSRDGRYLATASKQTVKIFEAETGALSRSLEERHDTTEDSLIRSLCFSPDGKFIATGSEDKMIRVWEVSPRKIRRFLSEHTAEVYAIECASDNRTVVSGSRDGTVKVWHVNRSKARHTLATPDGVSSVSVSSDMEFVVASCHDASIHVWNMQSGQLVAVLAGPAGHTDSAYCLSFLPTSAATFASGSLDRTVKLWKLRALLLGCGGASARHDGGGGGGGSSGVKTLYGHVQTLHGHTDFVVSIGVTPDACWILSGSKDRSFRLWDAYTGELQLVVHAHSNTVLSVAASNHYFATGGGDNIVRVWSYSPFLEY